MLLSYKRKKAGAPTSWETFEPVPQSTSDNYGAFGMLGDGRILVIGKSSVYSLDPSTIGGTPDGEWVLEENKPAPNTNYIKATGHPNGKVYAGFGINSNNYQFYAFEPSTNSWELLQSPYDSPQVLPSGNTGRLFEYTLTYGGPNDDIYLAAGSDSGWYDTIWKYDVNADVWSDPGETLNQIRQSAFSFHLADGKRVLVCSGSNSVTCEIYDPDTNICSYTGSLPQAATSGIGTVLQNGNPYLVGGGAGSATSSTNTFEFDVATETWTTRDPLPSPTGYAKQSHGLFTLSNGRIILSDRNSGNSYISTASL